MTHTLTLVVALLFPITASAADAFTLKDGDRVVLIGSTLIEREQRYGYWETALTERYPGVTFRNLGWSGDTVFGEARASFDPPAVGYKRLIERTRAAKPTVIFVGYGTNESYAGAEGLAKFTKQLGVLLDDLASTKARVVLLSPLRLEDLGRPLPDPKLQNQHVCRYADVLLNVARKRGYEFVNLYQLLGDGTKAVPPAPYTDDGLHLTAYGYWRSAAALEQGLQLKAARWNLQIAADGSAMSVIRGAKVDQGHLYPVRFEVTDEQLPRPGPRRMPPRGPSCPGPNGCCASTSCLWANTSLRSTASRRPRPARPNGLPVWP